MKFWWKSMKNVCMCFVSIMHLNRKVWKTCCFLFLIKWMNIKWNRNLTNKLYICLYENTNEKKKSTKQSWVNVAFILWWKKNCISERTNQKTYIVRQTIYCQFEQRMLFDLEIKMMVETLNTIDRLIDRCWDLSNLGNVLHFCEHFNCHRYRAMHYATQKIRSNCLTK